VAGHFITLEGGEGAGKTTLIDGIARALEAQGQKVIKTREPGGTPGAEAIRDLLVNGPVDRWSPTAEALLFYAARVDHVDRVIRPNVAAGNWVLCDRFADSTRAYQGAAGGISADRLDALHRMALERFEPDLTLVIDIDPMEGLERAWARGEAETRFEAKGQTFHERLRQGFLDIAHDNPGRCAVIDGGQAAGDVLSAALDVFRDRFGAP
jgi:dTMP kinase